MILVLQLTKISPPFRISICISTIIPSLILHGTGCSASERAFPGSFGNIFGCSSLSKHKNSLASCQRCRQSVGLWSAEYGKILSDFKWAGHRLAHIFADQQGHTNVKSHCWRRPQGHFFFVTKILSKRLCTRYWWRNMVCQRSGWSSWTGDWTSTPAVKCRP